MRGKSIVLYLVLASCSLPLMASQGPPVFAEKDGGDIWFPDTKKLPPVFFSHKQHLDAGNQCEDCHDKLFQKKAGATDVDKALNMKAMKKGKYCGACHNGKTAFTVKRFCTKCHIKRKKS